MRIDRRPFLSFFTRRALRNWAFLSRYSRSRAPRSWVFLSHYSRSRVCGWTFSRCITSQPFKRTRVFYVKKQKRCENAIKTNTKRKCFHRCTETEWKRNVNFILAATVSMSLSSKLCCTCTWPWGMRIDESFLAQHEGSNIHVHDSHTKVTKTWA